MMTELQIVRAALLVNDRLSPFEQRIVSRHAEEGARSAGGWICDCRSCSAFRVAYKEADRDGAY